MIIEVALGIEEAVGRREDGCGQLLGRRLTIRPSDRDDRDAQLLTVVAGEQLQGLQAVLDEDRALVDLCVGVIDDSIGSASLQCGTGILIAVEACSAQGEEDTALGELAGIGAHHGVGEVDGVEIFYRDHESGHKEVGEWEAPYGDTTIIYGVTKVLHSLNTA